MARPKGPQESTIVKKLAISNLVKEEMINWPRELKIMNTLMVTYGNFDFWRNANLGFKLNSMAWFLTYDGKTRLEHDYKMFNTKAPVLVECKIDDVKYGEDKKINKSPKTLNELFK